MAQYKIIVDQQSKFVHLKEQPLFTNCHEILLDHVISFIDDQTFQTYEEEPTGTTVGTVVSSTYDDVTFEIIAGNIGNAFTINSSNGVITTTIILDYETVPVYNLTVKVTVNGSPSLTDTGNITINVLRVYHICENYGVSESGTSVNNQVNYLSCNEIQLTTGTLGNYLIDWKLGNVNGNTVFTSGNAGNTDPDLQAEHPFYDLCQGGTLYPVFRYITVNGVRYTNIKFSDLGYYSPDLLTCLSPKTVGAMTCSNGLVGSTYNHTISYNNTTMPAAAAERTVTYMLNNDGSTTDFAWQFYGYLIADRIRIYYVSGIYETLLGDWVIGSDNVETNYGTIPKIYKSSYIKTAFSVSGFTYTSGDYIKFHITPSYNQPTITDTNWSLSINCFTQTEPLDLTLVTGSDFCALNTGTTLNMVYNNETCSYDIDVITSEGLPSTNDIYSYFIPINFGDGDYDTSSTISLRWNTGYTYNWLNNTGSDYFLNGTLTIERDLSTHMLTYTFTNNDDYLNYKNAYVALTGSSWNNYTTDPTNPNHYQQITMTQRISMTSGDTYSTDHIYIGPDSLFYFDDVNHIITIELRPFVSGYIPTSDCDLYFSSPLTTISTGINNFYSGDSFTHITIWGCIEFRAVRYPRVVNHDTSVEGRATLALRTGLLSPTLSFGPRFVPYFSDFLALHKRYLRIDITDVSDPINNYEVYTKLDCETGELYYDWVLIKKVGT